MKPVEQRKRWRPDDHPEGPQPGDCLAACVASIFEVPYEDCVEIDGTSQTLAKWVGDRFAGVTGQTRYLVPVDAREPLDAYLSWPTRHYEPGYWIANIWSARIPDRESFGCGCANRVPGGDADCEWCHGNPESRYMGTLWGLHSVVMRGGVLAWDPHPERDPDAPLYIRSISTFVAVAPHRLAWNCTRGACGERIVDECYHRKAA